MFTSFLCFLLVISGVGIHPLVMGQRTSDNIFLYAVQWHTSQWCSEDTANSEIASQLSEKNYVLTGLNEMEELLPGLKPQS